MNREEAMYILQKEKDEDIFVQTDYRRRVHKALDMAIEALQKEMERQEMAIRASERHLGLVRCKDCRWYENPRRKIFENCVRDGRIIPMKPTDYCSYGKRRKVEE